jgi:CDP-diacylglycerol--glycerol-3-phosphate 3-phosphatidyltransferase
LGKVKDLLIHPNSLTLYRIIAVPAIVVLMMYPNRFCSLLAGLIFSAAAITDYLDGYYARQLGIETNFGKIMDPLADKLVVCSAFIMLSSHGWAPGWVACVIIGRELAVTGLRNFVADKGEDLSSSSLGKYKTGFQIAALIPLLFHYPYFGIDMQAIGNFFMWGALIFTIWSGADYLFRFRNLIRLNE